MTRDHEAAPLARTRSKGGRFPATALVQGSPGTVSVVRCGPLSDSFREFECEQPMECGETCTKLYGHRNSEHSCGGHRASTTEPPPAWAFGEAIELIGGGSTYVIHYEKEEGE